MTFLSKSISGTALQVVRIRPSRHWLICAAALVAVLSTVVMLRQEARADPYRVATLGEWFFNPAQRNGFLQLATVDGALNAIYVLPGSNSVWVAGDGGLILRSTNSGATWERGRVVQAAGSARAAALWQRDLVRSDTLMGGQYAASVLCIYFLDETRGYAGTATGDLLYTTDGGLTWIAQPTTSDSIRAVRFTSRDMGFFWSAALLASTVDGGSTWDAAARRNTSFRLSSSSVWYVSKDTVNVLRPFRDPTTNSMTWMPVQSTVAERGEVADVLESSAGTDWLIMNRADTGVVYAKKAGGAPVWTAVSRRPLPRLQHVYFADSLKGWVLTEDGRLYYSTDGGTEWRAANLLGPHRIRDVRFVDGNRGWAVSRDGTILRSDDGGRRWRIVVGGSYRLLSVSFADRQYGWAVGTLGTILRTTDGGRSWRPQASETYQTLFAVQALDRRTAVAVGAGGTVLRTTDGTRWGTPGDSRGANQADEYEISPELAQAIVEEAEIQGIDPELALRLVSVESRFSGRATREVQYDNEATRGILRQSFQFLRRLLDKYSGDVRQALLAFDRSSDRPDDLLLRGMSRGNEFVDEVIGANRWTSEHTFRILYFPTPTDGYAFSDRGLVLRTRDGGARWDVLRGQTTRPIVGVHFPNTRNGWFMDADGVVYRVSADTIERDVSGLDLAEVHQPGVRFAPISGAEVFGRILGRRVSDASAVLSHSSDTLWAAGPRGAVLLSTGGGHEWVDEATGTDRDLYGVTTVDGRVWAVGEGGTILQRERGRWEPVVPGHRLPAPWYYFSWALVVGLIWAGLRVGYQEPITEIAQGTLVSDRPIERGDPDPLELGLLAQAVSQFLRNEQTDPPLTLAVTGRWGAGKSSLMNLIRGDLRAWGFRPVWFNAWHHQTEEHLLAALLENVRAQAIPPVYSLAGLRFRLRLLVIRTRNLRPLAVVAFLAVFVYAGYLLGEPSRLQTVWEALSTSAAAPMKTGGWEEAVGDRLRTLFPDVTALLGLAGVLAVVARSMKAFGVNPASLLASVSRSARIRDLGEQTSFRHRFAQEFAEVTEALRPWDLVVFVDDLDRCRSNQILSVLEGINFLCSSGKCVIVLGMDMERVEHCVALELRPEAPAAPDLAGPIITDDLGSSSITGHHTASSGEDLLRGFARSYLEKLINIEIPVPQPDPQKAVGLLVREDPGAFRAGPGEIKLLPHIVRSCRPLLPYATATLAAAVALLFGLVVFHPSGGPAVSSLRTEIPVPVRAQETSRAPTLGSPALAALVVQGPARVRSPAARVVRFDPAPPLERSFLPVFAGVLLTVASIGLMLLVRPNPIVHDSAPFKAALALWGPLVAERRETPRAIKKYLNRVRFCAMCQREPDPARSTPVRLWRALTGGAERPRYVQGAIPDHVLVALSALDECNPGCLRDKGAFTQFGNLVREWAREPRNDDTEARRRERDELMGLLAYPEALPLAFQERFHRLDVTLRRQSAVASKKRVHRDPW